jgi:hypothetical protein
MSWLTNHQLDQLVKRYGDEKTKDAFLGVFPIDKLPTEIKNYPTLLIVNTQTHNLGGEHWFALFISSQHRGEIFDSAVQPIDLRTLRWLNRFARHWTRNRLIYQSPLSATCGAYVLYYVLNRLRYSTMKEVLMPKQLKRPLNDSFIQDWHRNLIHSES